MRSLIMEKVLLAASCLVLFLIHRYAKNMFPSHAGLWNYTDSLLHLVVQLPGVTWWCRLELTASLISQILNTETEKAPTIRLLLPKIYEKYYKQHF